MYLMHPALVCRYKCVRKQKNKPNHIPFKFKEISSYGQFSSLMSTKENSVWIMIKRKTVTSIINSLKFERKQKQESILMSYLRHLCCPQPREAASPLGQLFLDLITVGRLFIYASTYVLGEPFIITHEMRVISLTH